MQHRSRDVVLHLQTDQIVMKRGKEKQKRKRRDARFALTVLCKPIKIEKSFGPQVIDAVFLFFTFCLSLFV